MDCYDYDSDGSHDFIGSFTTTVAEMMQASKQQVTREEVDLCTRNASGYFPLLGRLIPFKIESKTEPIFPTQSYLDKVNREML